MKKLAKRSFYVPSRWENMKLLLAVAGIYLTWVLLMFLGVYVILLGIERIVLGS